jgi:hypothetical protein
MKYFLASAAWSPRAKPSRRFIVSRVARSKLFRQRTGKRVCLASPLRLNNDCDTRFAE